MVVYLEQQCQRISYKVQPSQVAMGKQNLRHNHYRVWPDWPPEFERMRAACMQEKGKKLQQLTLVLFNLEEFRGGCLAV